MKVVSPGSSWETAGRGTKATAALTSIARIRLCAFDWAKLPLFRPRVARLNCKRGCTEHVGTVKVKSDRQLI